MGDGAATGPRRLVVRIVFRSVLAWLVVAAVLRSVVLLPERCPHVTPSELRAATAEAVGWFERNQQPDGRWLYRYDARADQDLGDYNLVRHAGVTMSLYQAYAAGHEGALRVADAGADHALGSLVTVEGGRAFGPSSGTVPTGASALLLAGLAERRAATGDPTHDEVMRDLGRFLVAMTEPSGSVVAYWNPERGAPETDDPSPFFPGEAYWALALLHRELPGEGWDHAAQRIGTYLATERDDAEGWFPDISDHWAAYGMATEAAWADADPRRAATIDPYAQRQAGIAGVQVRWESQRTGEWPTTWLRGGRTLGAGLGTLGEQLAGLWRFAGASGRADLQEPLAARAACVAGMLVDRQVSPEEAGGMAAPDRSRGAWFQRGITQMDDQQHAMSAVLLAEPIVRSQPVQVDEPWGAGAPRLVLFVALLLALDPLRAALVLRGGRSTAGVEGAAAGAEEPRIEGAVGSDHAPGGGGRRDLTGGAYVMSRRERLRVLAAGGAFTIGVTAALAALGGPLLDALDVSSPTLRIGAGLVALVTAAADMVRPQRPSLPLARGWWAGLVPLGVPVLVRPATVVLALSAGADAGILLVVDAAVLVVVLLGVVAALPARSGRDAGLATWVARLLAAFLAVVSIALVVDGVYDV